MNIRIRTRIGAAMMAVVMLLGLLPALSVPVQASQQKETAGEKEAPAPSGDNEHTVFDALGFDTSAPEGYREEESITETPYGRAFVNIQEIRELFVMNNTGDGKQNRIYGVDGDTMPETDFSNYFHERDEYWKAMEGGWWEPWYKTYQIDREPGKEDYQILLEGNFTRSNDGRKADVMSLAFTDMAAYRAEKRKMRKEFFPANEENIPDDVPGGRLVLSAVEEQYSGGDVNASIPVSINPLVEYRGGFGNAGENSSKYGTFAADYMAFNYLKATAGDFDADGIDEIALYVPMYNQPRIEVWDLQETGRDDERSIRDHGRRDYQNKENWKLAYSFPLEIEGGFVPNMVSLSAGDYDQNGVDDLALSWGYFGEKGPVGVFRASVLWGDMFDVDKGTSMLTRRMDFPLTDDQGNKILRASFAAGDVDGDGADELVMGGSLANTSIRTRYVAVYDWTGDEFVCVDQQQFDLGEKDQSGRYRWSGLVGGGDANPSEFYASSTAAPANIAVGRFYGMNESPCIYLDSLIIANGSDGLELRAMLKSLDQTWQGSPTYYVEYGAKCAVLTAGGSDCLLTSTRYYSGRNINTGALLEHIGRLFSPTDQQIKAVNLFSFGTSTDGKGNRTYSCKREYQVGNGQRGHEVSFCLPDVDNDTTYLEYTGEHFYSYSDPEVIAVLASPPYFKDMTDISGDLDDASMRESTTRYTASSGSGTGTTVGGGFSVGTYSRLEKEVKVLIFRLGSAEFEKESQHHFTWDMQRLSSVNYSITYGNQLGQDGVVFCAVPVESYVYNVYAPTGGGTYEKTTATVNIPYEPSVRVIDLKEYQKVWRDYKEILPKIDNTVLTHELGRPESYPSSIRELPGSGLKLVSPGDPSEIGQDGRSSISQSIEMTSEKTNSFNYEFELSFRLGLGRGSKTKGLSFSGRVGGGSVRVSTSGSAYEGELLALPTAAKKYGYCFNWKLAAFLYRERYPVVTYLVTSERAPAHLPTDFRVNEEETTDHSVTLEWDYDGQAAGFILYRYFTATAGSDYYEIATVGFDEGKSKGKGRRSFKYVDDGLAPDAPFSYCIQTIGNSLPNLSVPGCTLDTFTKPADAPVIELDHSRLKAFPDNEVSAKATVDSSAHGSYTYNWQKLINGSWTMLESLSVPHIRGIHTDTLTVAYGSEADAGQYRCEVTRKSSRSSVVKVYSPVLTVDFSRREAKFDGMPEIEQGKSIAVTMDGVETSSVPSGSVIFTLSREGKRMNYPARLDSNGRAVLSGLELDDGVYAVTAYYTGERVFKPAVLDPEPAVFYTTGLEGKSEENAFFLDVQEVYEYGDDLNFTEYEVAPDGRIVNSHSYGPKDYSAALENFERWDLTGSPMTGWMKLGTGKEEGQDDDKSRLKKIRLIDSRFSQGKAGWAGRYRFHHHGTYVFEVRTAPAEVEGLKQRYLYSSTENIRQNVNVLRTTLTLSDDKFNDTEVMHATDGYGVMQLYDRTGKRMPGDTMVPGTYVLRVQDTQGPYGSWIGNSPLENYDIRWPVADIRIAGPAYKIKASPAPGDGKKGTVSIVDPRDAHSAVSGQTVLMLAQPNPGFEVDHWTLNDKPVKGSEGKTRMVHLQRNEDSRYHVHFRFKENTLTVQTLPKAMAESGLRTEQVIKTDDPLFHNGSAYAAGYQMDFRTEPIDGWIFEHWEYTVEGKAAQFDSSGQFTVTMPDAPVMLRAVFTRQSYGLHLGEGLAAFDEKGKPVVNLTAIPGDTWITVRTKPGFTRAGGTWTVNGTAVPAQDDSYTFAIREDTDIRIPVTAGEFRVELAPAETFPGGTAWLEPAGEITAGSTVTAEASPSRDLVFDHWEVNGIDTENRDASWTFTAEEDVVLRPVFLQREGKTIRLGEQEDWEIITLEENPDYGASPRIYPGETIRITAYPKRGRMVSGWTIDGKYTADTENPLTITYEDAIDGAEVAPSYKPVAMFPVTTESRGIEFTVDGERSDDDDAAYPPYSEITFKYHGENTKDGYTYAKEWVVNGKPMKKIGAARSITLELDGPLEVSVRTDTKTHKVLLDPTEEFEVDVDGYDVWNSCYAADEPLTITVAIKEGFDPDTTRLRAEGFVREGDVWVWHTDALDRDYAFHSVHGGGPGTRKVSVRSAEHGTIVPVPKYPRAGQEVALLPRAEEGWQLGRITVRNSRFGETLPVYVNKAGQLCVTATGEEIDYGMEVEAEFCDNTVPQPVNDLLIGAEPGSDGARDFDLYYFRKDDDPALRQYPVRMKLLPENNTAERVEWTSEMSTVSVDQNGLLTFTPGMSAEGAVWATAYEKNGNRIPTRVGIRVYDGSLCSEVTASHLQPALGRSSIRSAEDWEFPIWPEQGHEKEYEADEIRIVNNETREEIPVEKRSGRYHFTMPPAPVTIAVTEKEQGKKGTQHIYDIHAGKSEGPGSYELEYALGIGGEELVLSRGFLPEEDCRVKSVSIVGDESGEEIPVTEKDGGFRFTMPEENVTVSVAYEAVPTYTCTVEGGTGGGTYFPGEQVEAVVDVPEGHQFTGWKADGVKPEDTKALSITFTMPEHDVTLKAKYGKAPAREPVTYAVAVDGGTTEKAEYPRGAEVTVTPKLPEGKRLKKWIAEGVELTDNTQTPLTFTMPGGKVYLRAILEDAPAVVSQVTVNNGTGSGQYAQGGQVEVRAQVPKGMVFRSWNAQGVTLDRPDSLYTVFTMPDNDVVLTPQFEHELYRMTIHGGTGGGGFRYGARVTVRPQVPVGMRFVGWTAEGAVLSDPLKQELTLTMPAGNVVLTANFEKLPVRAETCLVNFEAGAGRFPAGLVRSSMRANEDGTVALELMDQPSRGGFLFMGWFTEPEGGTRVTGSTVFTQDTTVYARWKPEHSTSGGTEPVFAVEISPSAHGLVTADPVKAAEGTVVTVKVKPEKGYAPDGVTVLDAEEKAVRVSEKDGTYRFTMPDGGVTVKAKLKRSDRPENPFRDVPEETFFTDAVLWAVENGVTAGRTADTFAPDDGCTRAQAVTFLWRSAGSPAPRSADSPFADVQPGSFYYDAVLWAVENGITAGKTADRFAPNDTCTRAQIVTFLWRLEKSPNAETADPFVDVSVGSYYADAVLWAVENGITAGKTADHFAPNDTCTRAQIVTFLYRDRQT